MSDAIKIFQPTGLLTGFSSHKLVKEFNESVSSGARTVLVDLQDIDFIDSSGLGVLVSMHTKLRLAGGQLYLCSPKEQAASLFDISDVNQFLKIFPTQADFYASVVHRNQAVLVQ
jgi:anti-anti-sigma factor